MDHCFHWKTRSLLGIYVWLSLIDDDSIISMRICHVPHTTLFYSFTSIPSFPVLIKRLDQQKRANRRLIKSFLTINNAHKNTFVHPQRTFSFFLPLFSLCLHGMNASAYVNKSLFFSASHDMPLEKWNWFSDAGEEATFFLECIGYAEGLKNYHVFLDWNWYTLKHPICYPGKTTPELQIDCRCRGTFD